MNADEVVRDGIGDTCPASKFTKFLGGLGLGKALISPWDVK